MMPVAPPAKRSQSAERRAQSIFTYVLLAVGSIAFIVPFYFVLNGSLQTEVEAQGGRMHVLPGSWLSNAPKGAPETLQNLTPAARDRLSRALTNQKLIAIDVAPGGESYRARVRTEKTQKINGTEQTVAIDYLYANRPDGSLTVEPLSPQWFNYPWALAREKMNFYPALANTVVITTLCVLGQIASCSLVGFGFARFRFRGRTLLFMIMLSTMMLPAQVTMIPVFVLFRWLGTIDTFWPLIIPAWLASPFFVFMFRQFFTQIPEELIEAARIDGCSNWRIYWQLMLPLSGPVIAIVAIYTFLGAWNDFMGPLIYLNSPDNRTLALALDSFRGQYGVSDAHLLMAASVVCMVPCVVLFFAAQKYFVESVASTGLKS